MTSLLVALTLVLLQVPTRPETLEDRVRRLGREIRVEKREDVPAFERAIAGGAPRALDSALRELTTDALLSDPDQPAERLQQRLRAVYDPWRGATEHTAQAPEVFSLTLAGRRVLIVTWLSWIGGGGAPLSHAQILAYVREGPLWTLRATTGDLFDNHGLYLIPVAARRTGELWFIAHGLRRGSSRVDINVALLGFDGRSFQTRWSRRDVAKGEVRVRPDGITLDYVVYPAQGGPDFTEYIEILEFTEDGLRTVSRRLK